MKKLFFAVLILMSIVNFASAQIIRAGVNLASMSASATEENYQDYKKQSVLGYQIGVAVPINITNSIAIQPEIMWIQKGGKSDYTLNNSNKVIINRTYNYVEVPVSLKLSLGNTTGDGVGFYVLGGPYVGLALNGNIKRETTIAGVTSTSEAKVDYSNDSNQEKRVDWGANLGVGLSLGRIYVDARYNLGINNLLDGDATNTNDDNPYQRNRGLGLTLGLKF